MEHTSKTLIPAYGRYVQSPGVIADLHAYLKDAEGSVLLLLNKRSSVVDQIETALSSMEQARDAVEFNGDCSQREIHRITEAARPFSQIIAAGDTSLLDTAKLVADTLGTPLVLVPVSPACFTACAHYANVYDDYRRFISSKRVIEGPHTVLADTDILSSASPRFLAAGIGGALAAARSAFAGLRYASDSLNEAAAASVASACWNAVLAHGRSAALSARDGHCTPALEDIWSASLFWAGVLLDAGGPSLAHAIGDSLSYIRGKGRLYPGERYAFGLLAQLIMENAPDDLLREIMELYIAVGLPVSFEELGFETLSEEMLTGVADQTLLRHLPYIHAEKRDLLDALRAADSLGRFFTAD